LGYGLPGLVINGVRLFIVALPLAAFFTIYCNYDFRMVAIASLCGTITSATIAGFWLKRKLKIILARPAPAEMATSS
jgi:Na+-driven multidrug efflux pump